REQIFGAVGAENLSSDCECKGTTFCLILQYFSRRSIVSFPTLVMKVYSLWFMGFEVEKRK
ncbi:MAG: hypothetical protein SO402_03765, partial [Prevotella sp.]|nr:hypothetical protein [Prevotella sp.]